jgi:heat shock protein HslJ
VYSVVVRVSLAPILVSVALGLSLTPLAFSAVGGDSAPVEAQVETSPSAAGAPMAAESVPAAGGLEGVDWVLLAYRAGDALVELDDPKGRARLRFGDGRLAGSAGCNRLMGAYTLAGDSLRFEPSMASTMMACPEPLMAQEQAVHAALSLVASHRLTADRLELLDADGVLLLRYTVLAPLPLAGPVWQLLAYNNGKQAIVSALAGTQITLELREDGTLGGSDGCNRYMSGFTLEGDRLTIGPIATTRMACRGPQGAAEQAAAFAAALGTVTGHRIEGDELTLINAEGTPAARFRADRSGAALGAASAN